METVQHSMKKYRFYVVVGPSKEVFMRWHATKTWTLAQHADWIRYVFGEARPAVYDGLAFVGVECEHARSWRAAGKTADGATWLVPKAGTVVAEQFRVLPQLAAPWILLQQEWRLPFNVNPGYLYDADLDILIATLPGNTKWPYVLDGDAHAIPSSDYWLLEEGKMPSDATLRYARGGSTLRLAEVQETPEPVPGDAWVEPVPGAAWAREVRS